VLTATEFANIEAHLLDRRHGYLNRRVPQPLIRLWDKKMRMLARITIPESWDCEEIAHDDGVAHIELVGKDNDWLREIVCFKTRPAEDLHITIDPDPDKPHDWKNRWSGKVDTIEDDDVRGQPVKTTLTCISNRKHLEHIYLAATPLLPEAVQPIKMFLWAGNCVTACSTAVAINLARIYTLNAFSPIPRNIFDPATWLENLSPLNWPVQVMPVNPIFDQSRFVTFGSRWKDAKTILTPVMKDAGVICHAYQWLPGDPAPYTVFGPELAEILKPTRACVILSFEDQSGVGGPTGTAIDGLLNLFAATADDLITESLFNLDQDGDGQTDPFIRKILGVAPKRPPFVYRDVGYGGAESRKMVIHKAKALRIITGGKSPQWVVCAPRATGGRRQHRLSIKQSRSQSAGVSANWRTSSHSAPPAPHRRPARKVSTTSTRASSTTPCWRSSHSSTPSAAETLAHTGSTSTSKQVPGLRSPSTR
jgi:hypothetical protein